jgi:cytochrome b subunit of formate dehydrogenase
MSAQTVSKQTQKNWWINASLFGSALIASLSGIYFLYLPNGGFQGGRNSLYNVQILFTRPTWDDLHTWGGVIMIVAAFIHLVLHWKWLVSTTRRVFKELTGQCGCTNPRGRWNLVLDLVVAISFVITAISGIYFLFVPGGRWVADPMVLFSRSTWDLLHTWAATVLISAVVIHFVIHWKWVTKVTRNMLGRGSGSNALQPTKPVIVSQ